jgi:integrase
VRTIGKGEAAVERRLSTATVNRALALLRHLLRLAHEEWEVLDSVPRVRMEREPEGRLRWLTPENANRLLAACGESRNSDLTDLVEFALFTGLRRGEVLDLMWERVDRARGVILLDVTKSGKRREVPLNSRADAVLARRGSKSSGLVFGTRKWDHFRSAWERAVDRAKLLDFHFHDLRHTFASWAVQRGASLQEVKDLLGHRSLAMTLRYGHLAPEHLRSAVARLDTTLPHLRFSASFSARDQGRGGAALEVAVVVGAPGRIRTPDPRIRSPTLCPTELQAHQVLTIHRTMRRKDRASYGLVLRRDGVSQAARPPLTAP